MSGYTESTSEFGFPELSPQAVVRVPQGVAIVCQPLNGAVYGPSNSRAREALCERLGQIPGIDGTFPAGVTLIPGHNINQLIGVSIVPGGERTTAAIIADIRELVRPCYAENTLATILPPGDDSPQKAFVVRLDLERRYDESEMTGLVNLLGHLPGVHSVISTNGHTVCFSPTHYYNSMARTRDVLGQVANELGLYLEKFEVTESPLPDLMLAEMDSLYSLLIDERPNFRDPSGRR